jgi:hypothetical protein
LVAAARRERVQSQRGYFAGLLLAIVLGTFAAWYYWENGAITNVSMAQVAERSLLLIIGCHAAALMGPILVRTTLSIAGEKDRRTLDFLMITRLSSAEIVLEKLAACLVLFGTTIAAGLPVMVLLHLLGGIDLRLILLAYAGLATTAFFLASLAIWFSVVAPDGRRAMNTSVFVVLVWLVWPTTLPIPLARFGLRLPEWAASVNAWVIASSPFSVAMKIAMGVGASIGLVDAVAWMGGLQLTGGTLLLIASVLRLRAVFRAHKSAEVRQLSRAARGPVWRFRRRPPVGDDPILWREMYTTRSHGVMKAIGVIITFGLLAALVYATYYFARPAVVEVWKHGYRAGMTSTSQPVANVFMSIFLRGFDVNAPVDAARIEFNMFLRYVTFTISILLTFVIAGSAAETLTLERARETWTSLLATPLSARAILRSAVLAAFWRMRLPIAILAILWTLGTLAGAIHPIGYLLGILNLAASLWLFTVWGVRASVEAKDQPTAAARGTSLAFLSLLFLALPFLLPGRINSVLFGAGSHPFVGWLSLASYREVRAALQGAAYPPLEWSGIRTGEGPLSVLATWLIGTLVPALGGWWAWRNAVDNFDRQVGRPWKAQPVAERVAHPVSLPLAETGSPLAEPGGAV